MKTKRLFLFFREICLGELKMSSGMFFWLPNMDGIKEATKEYEIAMKLFCLPKDKKIFEEIPVHFKEFLIGSEREDLKAKAQIADGDNDFEKLLKLGLLNFCNKDFVVKTL